MQTNQQVEAILAQMLASAKAQWGSAIKSSWFYASDGCPGCGRRVDAVRFKGSTTLSLNGFIHRKAGVLIGYTLCARCVKVVMDAGKKFPPAKTPLHDTIETNLISAYEHRNSESD